VSPLLVAGDGDGRLWFATLPEASRFRSERAGKADTSAELQRIGAGRLELPTSASQTRRSTTLNTGETMFPP